MTTEHQDRPPIRGAEEIDHRSGPDPSRAGLRSRVLRGGLLMSLVSVFTRGAGLVTSLVLAGLLTRDDFGLYATALGFVTIGAALRSVLRPVLIEALARAPESVGRIHSNMMWSVLAFAALGVAVSPLIGRLTDKPGLAPLLAVAFAIIPLQTLPVVGLARINESLAFARFGRITAMAVMLRHVATILAALVGLGPFSFLVGAAVAALTEVITVRVATGPYPRLQPPRFAAVSRSPRSAVPAPDGRRWIWLTAVGLALALSGDYLGASWFAAETLIGLYFFAYQLTGALFEPMNLAANTVLVPAFVKIEEPAVRRRSLIDVVRTLTVAGTLFFFPIAVVVAPATQLLYGGKWDGSIFALIAFAAYAPIRIAHPSTLSIARGCGFWSLFASDMVLVGVVTLLAGVVGGIVGSLEALVLFVVGGHFAVTVLSVVRLARQLGASLVSAIVALVGPWAVGMVGLGVTHFLTDGIDSTDLAGLPVRLALILVFLLVGVAVPYRKTILSTIGSVIRR